MDDRLAGLESAVEQLRAALLATQRRLDVLEAKGLGAKAGAAEDFSPSAAAMQPQTEPGALITRGWRDPAVALSLIGRLVIVLAGGFLLRAMTDTGVLAPGVGVTLGLAYGLVWLFVADRVGKRGQVPGAVFHSLAAAMVVYPLLLEATVRFKVLTGTSGAIAIAIVTASLLFVAWRRRLHAVAWVTVFVALPTSSVILVQTGVVVPFALYLIAFGVAALWMGYSLDWWALRWPVALAADLVVLGVTLRAMAPEPQDAPHVAMLVQLALLGAYLVSIAVRTLVRGRNVIPFEVVQTAAALVVGFGGAISLTRATGILPTSLGIASLVFGAACYGVAFEFLDRREDHRTNVYFYTTLALVLVLAGFTLVLGAQWLGVVFAALAVLTAGLWSRIGRLFMLVHGAAYIVAAGIVSGTLRYCAGTLAVGASAPWALPSAVMFVVIVAGAVSAWLASTQPGSDAGAGASGLRLVIALVFVCAAGGCVVGYLAPIAGGLADGGVAAGVLATVRTSVLALATLAIAWIGHHARFREWGWLVYPLLVGIGLKMVAQDFLYSRPATLFIAMALYGTALIVAPRLRRLGDDVNAPSRDS